jgi:O-antigen ligase
MGDDFSGRYARSWWRLPGLVLLGFATLLPLFWLRGPRLVLLVLGGTALAVAGAALFAKPYATLLAAFFVGYSALGRFIPGPTASLLILIVVARLAYDVLGGARLEFGSRTHCVTLAVLLGACLTSTLAARDWSLVGNETFLILSGLSTALAIAHFARDPRRVAGVCLAVSGGIAVSTLAVLRGLLGAGGGGKLLELVAQLRLGGLGFEPNALAVFANTLLPLVLASLAHVRPRARWALAAIVLLLIGTVILTQSRAGMLVLGMTLVGLVLRARRARPYAAAALVVLVTVALLLPPIYWVRFESIAQFGGIVVDRSLQIRQHVLEGGWSMFLGHPWLGVGLGNFRANSPSFMLGGYVAHNAYVENLASLGLVGGLAYVAWLTSGIGMAMSAARRFRAAGRRADQTLAEAIAIAFAVFAVSAATLSISFFGILFVLFGLALAMRRIAPQSLPTAGLEGTAPGSQ